MSLDFSTALPLILLGLALLAVAVWLLTRRNRKAKVVEDGSAPALARDVLDEGAEKARRNQALIDAAPAAVKVMAEPVPVPMPMPAPAPAPAPAVADDLTRIKGVGPKLVTLLGELGVTSYAQIAAWSDADVERIDAELGRFKGRITRDQWIEQAKLLAAGDEAAFSDKFGRNG
ncbi:MAG: LPXTG cell wall anchor domain-containing protein [Erythrobacter sp.]|nr:LPXTG cell wall anchor domain-containing protein [Erythrobacter sp.]MDZ4274323.1 LPXTG cell wall anchor domain-containing protein [Erythrobacter sp.]MDZ4277334.1 LPXTG cell wall anchor domain-containing protein [Erythrobacter sp.]